MNDKPDEAQEGPIALFGEAGVEGQATIGDPPDEHEEDLRRVAEKFKGLTSAGNEGAQKLADLAKLLRVQEEMDR